MYGPNQCLMCGAVSLIAKIQRPKSKEMEIVITPLTVTSRDPPVKTLLLVSTTKLYSAAIDVLVSKNDDFPRRYHNDTIGLEAKNLRLLPGRFTFLMLLNQ